MAEKKQGKERNYPHTLRSKLMKMPREGVKFILAYDFTRTGAEKVVEAARQKDADRINKILLDVVEAPEWTLEELLKAPRPKRKTRYLIVAVRDDVFYQKEVTKHLDFVHRSLGYKDEVYIETHLVKTVKEGLIKLGIIPVNNHGVQEIDLNTVDMVYQLLPTLS